MNEKAGPVPGFFCRGPDVETRCATARLWVLYARPAKSALNLYGSTAQFHGIDNEDCDARCHLSGWVGDPVRDPDRLRRVLRKSLRGSAMAEPILGLVVAVCLGAYLVYTLLHPEKF